MNKGSQPSVNSFCCFSTVALACRDGNTERLFIPRVILLTIGNSRTVVGRNSRSSIISNFFFTSSKLPFHAGILKISPLSPVTGFKFQNFTELALGLVWTLLFAPNSALQLYSEVEHSSALSTLLACTSSALSHLEHLLGSRECH